MFTSYSVEAITWCCIRLHWRKQLINNFRHGKTVFCVILLKLKLLGPLHKSRWYDMISIQYSLHDMLVYNCLHHHALFQSAHMWPWKALYMLIGELHTLPSLHLCSYHWLLRNDGDNCNYICSRTILQPSIMFAMISLWQGSPLQHTRWYTLQFILIWYESKLWRWFNSTQTLIC